MKHARVAIIHNPVEYSESESFQAALAEKRHDPECSSDSVLLLQHRPVITLGRSTKDGHILRPEAELRSAGISLATTARGGDVTFHGPGQLVVYPVMKLVDEEADVRQYIRNLEEAAMRTLSDWQISSFLRDGMIGMWTDTGKIGAIGVRIRRWITTHGLSLNVSVDLSSFDNIVPCGLDDRRVTSMETILGDRCPPLADIHSSFCSHFSEVFERELAVSSFEVLPHEWLS